MIQFMTNIASDYLVNEEYNNADLVNYEYYL